MKTKEEIIGEMIKNAKPISPELGKAWADFFEWQIRRGERIRKALKYIFGISKRKAKRKK